MILSNIEYLIRTPLAWLRILTWPVFSVTSSRIVSALLRQGVRPKTVIDVGANAGQFSIACAKLIPGIAVHAFEPAPESFKKLVRNAVQFESVALHPVALGDRIGEVEFRLNSHSHSSSILPLGEGHRVAFPEAQESGKIVVRFSTLDEEFSKVSLLQPVLLKLDVQGYEFQVLAGGVATLERIDFVLLEASFRQLYVGEKIFLEIVRKMESLGFEFLRPVSFLSAKDGEEILQADILFKKRE